MSIIIVSGDVFHNVAAIGTVIFKRNEIVGINRERIVLVRDDLKLVDIFLSVLVLLNGRLNVFAKIVCRALHIFIRKAERLGLLLLGLGIGVFYRDLVRVDLVFRIVKHRVLVAPDNAVYLSGVNGGASAAASSAAASASAVAFGGAGRSARAAGRDVNKTSVRLIGRYVVSVVNKDNGAFTRDGR